MAFRVHHGTALPGVFVISGISLLIHVPFLLLISRRIGLIEKSDSFRRQRVSFATANPFKRLGSQKSGNSFGSRSLSVKRSPAPAEDGIKLPEDEAQRQQLLKLLLKKENEARPPVVTGPQGGGVQTTYRVDIPVPDDSESIRNRHLSVPASFSHDKIYQTVTPTSDGQSYGATWQPGDSAQAWQSVGRQGSLPLIPQTVTPIHPRTSTLKHNRDTSYLSTGSTDEAGTHPSQHDPEKQRQSPPQRPKLRQTPSQVDRERRRREIELGETSRLPAYSNNGVLETPTDSKVIWKQRYG